MSDHLFSFTIMTLIGASVLSAESKAPQVAQPILASDYSYSYWENSWRKYNGQDFKDILCFETDSFGLKLDVQDITHPAFGLLNSPSTHLDTLRSGTNRLESLTKGTLNLEVEQGGSIYKLVSCKASHDPSIDRLGTVRMWEAGTIAQHFDVQELIFKNDKDEQLVTDSSLHLTVWPNSLTLTPRISPAHSFGQGTITGFKGNGICLTSQAHPVPKSKIDAAKQFTAECWVKLPEQLVKRPQGWLLCNNDNESADGNFGFLARRNKFAACINVGGGRENYAEIMGQTYMNKEKWHQLVLSYDGKVARFYLDGKEENAVEINRPRKVGKEGIILGQRGDKKGGLSKALYDQVRYWNRALSEKEIESLYTKAQDPLTPALSKGLALNEDFGEGYQAPHWKDATIRLSLDNGKQSAKTERKVAGAWEIGHEEKLPLTINFNDKPVENPALKLSLTTADKKVHPLNFNPANNSYHTHLEESSFIKGGYREIRDYDEYLIKIENSGTEATRVPVNLHLAKPANITGISPMLCNEDGTLSGIHVQLSKNWHYSKLGDYFRPYMILPAKPGTTTYKLRVAYGFYGALPAASHSQLSLVGYANNSRWDQLAVGCWGETICFDMDQACVPNAITDVRGLMLRHGKEGRKWDWTEAGWGGDWLTIRGAKKSRLHFAEIKTAYHAHGPCLSDVRYHGYMGADREVDLSAQVHTARADDLPRTFQNLEYTFNKTIPLDVLSSNVTLFTVGGHPSITPTFAYGNKKEMQVHERIPKTAKTGHLLVDRHTITGDGPWWISLPDSKPAPRVGRGDWGTGARALIVRSYEATFGGKKYTNPTVTIPVSHARGKSNKGVKIHLTPPKEVRNIQPGDKVSMKLEWITLPRIADDYYGPNEAFRDFLQKNPNSWAPVHREAAGNDLEVIVEKGELLNNYPLLIKANKAQDNNQDLTFSIKGGVGPVPVRIEGLQDPTGYALYRLIDGQYQKLDTTAHGNDDSQLDYNTTTKTYQLSTNIPLDNISESTWLFAKNPPTK